MSLRRAQCDNCTCSPGLLSRQNKRSISFAKQISLRRRSSQSPAPGTESTKTSRRTPSIFSFATCDQQTGEYDEMNTSNRLNALRRQMAAHDLAVYVVPSEDAHQSEYVSLADQRREFISGFSGSAGVAVVTRDIASLNAEPEGLAALSTDGRYFAQAANELDFNWTLLKQGAQGVPTWQEWTVAQAVQQAKDTGKETRIGMDPALVSHAQVQSLQKLLAEQKAENLVLLVGVKNLVDAIWEAFEPLPVRPLNPIKTLADQYTGETSVAKLATVRALLKENAASAIVVSALDQIAWCLNLRGSDVEYNPIFYAYLVVTEDAATLYADNSEDATRLGPSVQEYLAAISVTVKPYSAIWTDLPNLSKTVLLPSGSSWAVQSALTASTKAMRSPLDDLKSVKNAVELAGFASAHEKDGLALVKFFAWLEEELTVKCSLIDEVAAADKQLEFRQASGETFVGLSFETISSTGENAAVIHYAPKRGECKTINPDKIYLNDSGAQFLDGTTDTTRTLYFGDSKKLAPEQAANYTRVLQGNLALQEARFPEGTTGYQLDVLARQFLWSDALDYRHGTGHGLGCYLNVHEGPMGVGPRLSYNDVALKAGNVLSNEPGYYKDGDYGIRIENVMYVREVTGEDGSACRFGDKKFLEFVNVTMVPYCRKLIDVSLLSVAERAIIDAYHQKVWTTYEGKLDKGTYAHQWLKRETAPL
ncbi:hypothetical protein BABINDRAFT_38277 [Babjeviella inositovora NRRL Y-12698]|uniref:Xaa-Pro aminopeptidase n=1 Tax=Babjeviella inositovora NRRL Y-12698 TaxID=984486 RepID=A0A1E3QNA5_9ASCO|nr:uncharacterized protein BABINDRAFT_38277 [Babjeviella inositovora NRRL Y-12698]ODQ79163.1 hypothetical protein BABINDRAFT_38277 [Babjeviella inositovora NRRL Y-12698]